MADREEIEDSDSDFNLIKNHVTGKSRISQACDRCRIKKIKCDGKLPNCTNCELINFNCKISDKLTRNSFPKGYTKNLEKQLLDLQIERSNLLSELDVLRKKSGTSTAIHSTTITTANSPNFASNSEQPNNVNNNNNNNNNNTNKPNPVNSQGVVIIDQYIKHPLNLFFNSLDLYTFNGYESNINPDSNIDVKNPKDQLNSTKDDPISNYHMNLNRYLNLIFYKLISPLISIDDSNSKLTNLDNLIHSFFNNYNKLLNILNFDIIYNDYLKFKNKYNQLTSNYYDPITGELKKKFHNFNTREQDFLVKLIFIMKFQLTNSNSNQSFNEALKIISLANIKLCLQNVNFNINPSLEKLENCLLFIYYYLNFENDNLLLTKFNKSRQSQSFLLNIVQTSNYLVTTLNIHKNLDDLSFVDESSFPTDPLSSSFELSQILKIQRIKLFWIYKILIKWFKISYNFNSSLYEIDNSNDSPKSLDSIRLLDSDLFNTIKLFEMLQLIPNDLFELVINDYESLESSQLLSTIDRRLVKWFEKFEKSLATISSTTKEDMHSSSSSTSKQGGSNESNGSKKPFQLLSIYYFFRIMINLKYSNESIVDSIDQKLLLFQLSNDYINLSYSTLTSSSENNTTLNDFFQFGKLLQLISIICIGKLGSNPKLQSILTESSSSSTSSSKSSDPEAFFISINNRVLKILKFYQSSIINLKIIDTSIISIVKYIKEKLDLNSPSPQQQPNSGDVDSSSSSFYLDNNDDELNDLFLYKSSDSTRTHLSKPLTQTPHNHHLNLNLFDSNIFDNQSPIYDPLTAFKEDASAKSSSSLKRMSNSSQVSSSNKRQLKSNSSSPTSSLISLSANANSLFPSSSSSVSRTPSISTSNLPIQSNRRYSVSSSVQSYPSLFNNNNNTNTSSTNSTPLIKPYSSKSSKKQRSFSLSTLNHSNNHSNDTLFDSLGSNASYSSSSNGLRRLKNKAGPYNDTLFNITETSPANTQQQHQQQNDQKENSSSSSNNSNELNSVGFDNSTFDRMSIQSTLTSTTSSSSTTNNHKFDLHFSKIDPQQQQINSIAMENQDEVIHSTNDILNDFLTNTIPSTPHMLQHTNSYSNILNQLDSSSGTLTEQQQLNGTSKIGFDLNNLTTLQDDEEGYPDSDTSVLNPSRITAGNPVSNDSVNLNIDEDENEDDGYPKNLEIKEEKQEEEDVNKNLFASAIGNFSYASSPVNEDKLKDTFSRGLMDMDVDAVATGDQFIGNDIKDGADKLISS